MSDDEISQDDNVDPNRGKPPPRQISGAVTGSGAGAGGGGGGEDYDDDPVTGGGRVDIPVVPTPHSGGDASEHGSR